MIRSLAFTILLGSAIACPTKAQEKPGAPPELNEAFRDPDVDQFVERFESESREVATLQDEVLKILELKPGMRVADVGAGTGLYTIPMAQAVGAEGAVFAVDIAPNFLNYIARRAQQQQLINVCTVLGTQDSTQLPPETLDLVFICDTYHHFEDPAAVLGSIHRSMKPGARLVVIDFDRREGVSSPFIMEHVRADSQTFIQEIAATGFRPIDMEEIDLPPFEENFMAIFVREGRQTGSTSETSR
ncbi:class I SAM-dependent methyltransferase [Tautonia rosea]|uniref:class I SAM-dependent methyltransferase n=1 Tax=Tautonia rosea TaxID=2728037 RepID=UPI001473F036|nr:methyltransferase domain-containing protein [Tautonia rosea]